MEGIPLELSVDAGVAQLCAPDVDTSVVSHEESAQASDGGDVACEMEGFFCRDGRVSSCSKPKVAVCSHGCADLDDLQLDDDDDDVHAAALILCARR